MTIVPYSGSIEAWPQAPTASTGPSNGARHWHPKERRLSVPAAALRRPETLPGPVASAVPPSQRRHQPCRNPPAGCSTTSATFRPPLPPSVATLLSPDPTSTSLPPSRRPHHGASRPASLGGLLAS